MAVGNVLVLSGNLTRDPEAKSFKSGSTKVSCGIAWNQNVKQEDGSWDTVPHFFNVEAWGAAGRTLLKFKKGNLATIYGRLDWHSWETDDGQHREAVVILADQVIGEAMYEKAAPDVSGGGRSPDADPEQRRGGGRSSGSAKGSGQRPRPAPDPGPVSPAEQEGGDDGIPW